MGITTALNNAVTGLNATTRITEVVSSNLSNALTDGYARRTVALSSVQVGDRGGGVAIDGITRIVDPGLLADRRLADAALAGQERGAEMLTRLELALGTPDDAAGLSARLAAVERALITASSDPASDTRLTSIVASLQDLTATLNANTRSIQTMRQEADSAIARDIETLNARLVFVEEMNRDILRIGATGNDTSALQDVRQRAIDDIAAIVPLRVVRRDNGTVALMTTNGTQLLESRALQFGFQATPTITGDMTLASGALQGITLDGVPLDPATGVGRLDGGSLGAAFALRDRTLVEMQAGLDTIAADLIARFQDPGNDPTLAPGDLGLLVDEGGVLDLADLPGLAGRIGVNPAIVADQGGDPTLLRDGLGAMAPGLAGDATQLNRWIAALSVSRSDVPGSAAQSAAGRIASYGATVGTTRLLAEEQLSFATARWETLKEAELALGVDTDVELQTLLVAEQAYAANAKVIQTVDVMLQRLLEI